MNTILNRYRLRREATARRVSAESAFNSPRLLPLLSISPLPSITPPERNESLEHHAFAYSSQQASTPPNLNLFRRDSFVFAGDFSRDPKHRLSSYLLGALGMKVSVEPLSTWVPDIRVDEPLSGCPQVVILFDTHTGHVIGLRICARHEVYEWVFRKIGARANQQPSLPDGRMGRTRDVIKRYPRTSQSLPPIDQPATVEAYERSRWHSVGHNRRDKSH
ncbi:hypothetical protein PMI35_03057 [Pseudomonas sp. GM78]|nr:hypothetical protein PMI35_03057 [Pseudomonas sp. GM78]